MKPTKAQSYWTLAAMALFVAASLVGIWLAAADGWFAPKPGEKYPAPVGVYR